MTFFRQPHTNKLAINATQSKGFHRRVAAAMVLAAACVGHGQVHAQASSTDSNTVNLPSGVVVQFTKKTEGAKPGPTSVVRAHYRGTLTNGTEFDSSYKRRMPAEFPLNRVVPCWTQALQLMSIGSKATLTCPANTAYGAAGVPGVIPPNSTLTFEVELMDFVK